MLQLSETTCYSKKVCNSQHTKLIRVRSFIAWLDNEGASASIANNCFRLNIRQNLECIS